MEVGALSLYKWPITKGLLLGNVADWDFPRLFCGRGGGSGRYSLCSLVNAKRTQTKQKKHRINSHEWAVRANERTDELVAQFGFLIILDHSVSCFTPEERSWDIVSFFVSEGKAIFSRVFARLRICKQISNAKSLLMLNFKTFLSSHYGSEQPEAGKSYHSFAHKLGSEWVSKRANERNRAPEQSKQSEQSSKWTRPKTHAPISDCSEPI